MDIGEFNGRRLYTELNLAYGLRLWVPTFTSPVVEFLVIIW